MITDEQARAALTVLDSLGEDDLGSDADTDATGVLMAWARQELDSREQHDDGPMTPEEAERAYDEADAEPISDEEVETLLGRMRDRSNDGSITAEWCREHGAEWCDRRKAWRWLVSTVDVLWTVDGGVELIGRWSLDCITTRHQLLALLAALRGEHPHVSRGQANNIGPSR